MMERAGKSADDLEAETLPERRGALVGAHHKIKLHSGEAALARAIEGMRAHRTRHTAAGGSGSSYVAAVGYVRAAALLVGLQKIRANNLGVLFRDEDFVAGSKPVIEGILPPHVSPGRVCLAGSEPGLQDTPDGTQDRGATFTAGFPVT